MTRNFRALFTALLLLPVAAHAVPLPVRPEAKFYPLPPARTAVNTPALSAPASAQSAAPPAVIAEADFPRPGQNGKAVTRTMSASQAQQILSLYAARQ